MTTRINLRLMILIAGFIAALTVYYMNYKAAEKYKLPQIIDITRLLRQRGRASRVVATNIHNQGTLPKKYSISSSNCKMLAPNPWDVSIQKYLTKPKKLICSHSPVLSYIDQLQNLTNVLKIYKKHINKYKAHSSHFLRCCHSLGTRINQKPINYNSTADSMYHLSKCEPFTDEVSLPKDAEFVLVKCQSLQRENQTGKEVYKDMHPIISVTTKVAARPNHASNDIPTAKTSKVHNGKLNVIILGIDSVSKLNLRRIMPRTLKLLQNRGWIELHGYNKIGENTFPNLMAILSGEPMKKLDAWWGNRSRKMDDCPNIWKDYKANGYVTLYAEDTPSISTFNLNRTGFVDKPTDYYLRPFMLAAHQLLRLKSLNGLPVCVGPVMVVDHILNYAKRFYKVFSNHNHFSLLWLNSLTHNDLNAPKALDKTIYKFLDDISNLGIYENSLILLLSDHGVRFGNIRETFIGYLEERLPFMFIWFPKWFRDRYPQKYSNLLLNQNRLTSPYDVHAMLKTMLYPNIENELYVSNPISAACPKCNGLLEAQPEHRTCADASIDLNWCLCSEFKSVDRKTALVLGAFVYNYIVTKTNELLKRERVSKALCLKWKFSKIFRSQEKVHLEALPHYTRNTSELQNYSNEQKKFKINIFVVTVELNPGRTKFEATIKMNSTLNNVTDKKPHFQFMEFPKRLDGIYKTSKCVKVPSLKHYCYCKHQ